MMMLFAEAANVELGLDVWTFLGIMALAFFVLPSVLVLGVQKIVSFVHRRHAESPAVQFDRTAPGPPT